MRRQSGTTSLRALIYFDEDFGSFPRIRQPTDERPLLSPEAGARYRCGIVLVTQNPVDMDKKGLTNAGPGLLANSRRTAIKTAFWRDEGKPGAGTSLDRKTLAKPSPGSVRACF